MTKKYIAFIETKKEFKGDVLGVVFPDFPGCVSCGNNFDEAYKMAHEALSGHVEAMKEHGYNIPEPSTLENIEKNWEDFKNWKRTKYAIAYIGLIPSSETRKYTISMDASLMAQIDSIAKNRSKFIARAVEKVLGINE